MDCMDIDILHIVSALLFAAAIVHTFSTRLFQRLANRHPRHAGLLHLLGEVEVVFGFWAMVMVIAMALMAGRSTAIEYVETRQYTEPIFVVVVMVVAASRPVLDAVQRLIAALAGALPGRTEVISVWLGLAAVPLLGSFITEPAAMTLAALLLGPQVFRQNLPEPLKYAALGVLFVNVSIGGTLTSYAAPPVLMVATTWNWDTAYMASTFGTSACIAVLINATAVTFLLRRHLNADTGPGATSPREPVPLLVSLIHLGFLAAIVGYAHHPTIFIALFLFFLGFAQAYERHQDPLILKEGLLVGFFLAGLVVLGGMQEWWLQPIVSGLAPLELFFGTLGLTAITDNAALTYLGSLITDMPLESRYMLVAGAVAGGGLTVIANAPNPAGVALLRRGFNDESIGAGGLLLGALPPTVVAAASFLIRF
jgi:hypothetical protein